MSQLPVPASWKKPQARMRSTQTDPSFKLNTSPPASTRKRTASWHYLIESIIRYLTVIFTYVHHTYIAIQCQTGEASFPVNKEGNRAFNATCNYCASHTAWFAKYSVKPEISQKHCSASTEVWRRKHLDWTNVPWQHKHYLQNYLRIHQHTLSPFSPSPPPRL